VNGVGGGKGRWVGFTEPQARVHATTGKDTPILLTLGTLLIASALCENKRTPP
jgi:hypothetical protein